MSSSICSNLSSSLKASLSDCWQVSIDPQYSEIIQPLLKAALAKSPKPLNGSFVCFISSLRKSESGYSQNGSRMSQDQSILTLQSPQQLYKDQIQYHNYMQNQKADVDKQEIEAKFAQMFSNPFNTVCFECGRKTEQWVETGLAIFLCLTCAGLYKAASEQINIKCITLDPFSPEQLKYIGLGGNNKLKEFLCNYEMQEFIYRQKLQTKAIAYYRTLLKEEFYGRMPPMAPDLEVGREFAHPVKRFTEMSPGQVFDQLSSKAKKAGESAIQLGERVFSKIHQKISSGEIKEGAAHLKQSITTNVKGLWHSLTKRGEASDSKEKEQIKQ